MAGEYKIYSVYSGAISDTLNSGVMFHYKDIGYITFNSDNNGKYEYDNVEYPFTWSILTNENANTQRFQIDINAANVSDYSSPFLYYYFSGQSGTPFMHSEEDEIRQYDMSIINSFTIQCRFNPGGSSGLDNFGGIEFTLTEKQ